MKKAISIVVTVAIIVVAGMVAGSGCVQKPIRIGAILSITGAGDYMGADVRDGMLLAVDEVNSRGGINGRKIEWVKSHFSHLIYICFQGELKCT